MAKRTTDSRPEGPMPDETIQSFFNQLKSQRSVAQEEVKECGSIYRNFEKQGGDKPALKDVLKMDGWGVDKASAYIRNVLHYGELLGIFSLKPDLVDLAEGHGSMPDAASANGKAEQVKAKAKAKPAAKRPSQRDRVTSLEDAKAARALAAETPAGYA